MNDKLHDDIVKLISMASLNGTLTSEAVVYFKNTLDENKKLQNANNSQKEIIIQKNQELSELKSKYDKLKSLENEILNREKQIIEREKNITKLECSLEMEKERVKDHKEMFSLIFRNIETRRNVFTPLDGGPHGSGFVSINEQIESKK